MMKQLLLIVLTISTYSLFAQKVEKPKHTFICNDKIITQTQADSLVQCNAIKMMHMGISQEERQRLAKTLGDHILLDDFLVKLELYEEGEERPTKEEMVLKAKAHNEKNKAKTKTKDRSFVLNMGDKAADFELKMLDGSTVKLSDLKGKVVLVNFWATWCGPCMSEFYEMPDKIIEPFKDSDLVVLPISRGETFDKVSSKMDHLKTKGIEFNVGLDPKMEIWKQYASNGIPKNFLIDKEGNICFTLSGYSKSGMEELAQEIEKALK